MTTEGTEYPEPFATLPELGARVRLNSPRPGARVATVTGYGYEVGETGHGRSVVLVVLDQPVAIGSPVEYPALAEDHPDALHVSSLTADAANLYPLVPCLAADLTHTA